MNDKIEVDGITIIVERKRMKNMYLRIRREDGMAKITAPRSMSEANIYAFAKEKIEWIKKHQQIYKQETPIEEKEYVTGDQVYFFGDICTLKIYWSAGKTKVYKNANTIYLEVSKKSTSLERKELLDGWYRQELMKEIVASMKRCCPVVGKEPNEWHIKKMKTRWGTCNVEKKRIWLNFDLVYYPVKCLDYVVTHELVHLYERGHNKVFYGYMDQFYPNWKDVKKQLNNPLERL